MVNEPKKPVRIARLVLWVGILLASPSANAAAPTALRIAYPAPTSSFLPLWAEHEAGFFKKHDLSAELIQVGSSTRGMAALIAGQIDILARGGTGGIVAQLQGYSDLAIFGTNVHTWVFSIYSASEIIEVAQLRGKKMGVTRFGGTLDFAARHFLKQHGLDPAKDVTLIQVGGSPDILTALANRLVDSGVMSVPYLFFARRMGLRELADLSQAGIRYAQAALVAKRSFLKNNQEVVTRFIRASIEATHYLKNRPAEGMRVLGKYTRTDDAEILNLDYDYHVQKLLSAVPDIRATDIQLLGEVTALPIPAGSEIAFEGFCTADEYRDEGPFGEYTGYYASGRGKEPIVELQALYHRDDPINLGAAPHRPPHDYSYMLSLTKSVSVKESLVKDGIPDVRGVWYHEAAGVNFFVVVSIRQRYPGHARQAAYVAAQCQAAGNHLGRYIVVVDDDIDPTNLDEVIWAIGTRSNPEKDIDIIRNTYASPLDPIYPKQAEKVFFGARAIIDACRPYDWIRDFPKVAQASPDLKRKVLDQWQELFS